jgi:hypothetical protein
MALKVARFCMALFCAGAEEKVPLSDMIKEVADATDTPFSKTGWVPEGVKMEDSASELSQKLEQLQALLDAKGDNADPDLKKRLAGLADQLDKLGLGGALDTGGSIPASKELTEFLTVCVGLSMKHLTSASKRSSGVTALKLLVQGRLKPEEAQHMDLWKLTASCINHMTEAELEQFKKSKLAKLPKTYVDQAKTPEAEKQVMELDAQMWGELKTIAIAMVGDDEDPTMNTAIVPGILAGILFLGAVGFLAKKFMDMQNSGDKDKKKKREGKKSK